MPKNKITVLVNCTDDNYGGGWGYKGLGAVLVTAETFDEFKEKFEDAFKFHIESCINDGDPVPDYIISGDYEFDFHMKDGTLTSYGNKDVNGRQAKK